VGRKKVAKRQPLEKQTVDLHGMGSIKLINKLVKEETKAKMNLDSILRLNRFDIAKKHNGKGFSEHSLSNFKYTKDKVGLFGNKAKIYGCVDDDYNSADSI
jgi:hypothetical protein